ncbi:hypothetical protein C4K37_2138 [Pseudomonas chlororaphis subsp. piscium]|uniref:Uncharacterized protein n=1 Tax=Pseudomonas chlororaphis TaxID=587753 RepID=A0AAX3G336_9PSED|nr:hypothetical protein C4K37_2138 [Pseudomonas chlororaphis subsp. piscium]AZC43071.1 hypothetical protein C4K36_2145 [Pseudomonas chlororaphis subsp. piscium]VEF77432.1 Uncharacterised protein [Pseudomonas chlororaphis]
MASGALSAYLGEFVDCEVEFSATMLGKVVRVVVRFKILAAKD